MGQNIFIDGPDFKVLASNEIETLTTRRDDEIIEAFDFGWNKKIYFLPKSVGEDFPSLLVYYAFGCAVKQISKENFKGLKRLNELNLGSNQIEKIEKDTFEDLVELRVLYLALNRISFMTGEVFKKMHKLTSVALSDNSCIDVDFDDPLQIDILMKEVSEKCDINYSTTTTEVYYDSKRIKALESKLRQAMRKIDDLEAELDELKLRCEGV